MNCTFQNMPIKHCGCARHIIANSNLVKKKKVFTKSFMSQLTLQFVRIPILQSLLQQFSLCLL